MRDAPQSHTVVGAGGLYLSFPISMRVLVSCAVKHTDWGKMEGRGEEQRGLSRWYFTEFMKENTLLRPFV